MTFKTKFLLSVVGGIGFLVLLGMIFGSEGQQFLFVNATDEPLNIVFDRDSKYEVDETLPPHSVAFGYVSPGTYTLQVFDDKGREVRALGEYEIAEDDMSDYVVIDLGGKHQFVTASAKYLYDADEGSLAKHMMNAGGRQKIFVAAHSAGKPFRVKHMIFPFEKLPEEVDALGSVYTLVPVPQGITTGQELLEAVHQDLSSR